MTWAEYQEVHGVKVQARIAKILKSQGKENNYTLEDLQAADELARKYFIKRQKTNRNRREHDAALRSLGLKKVRGSLGGIYWE